MGQGFLIIIFFKTFFYIYIVFLIYYSFDSSVLFLQDPTENHMYVKLAPCWKILIIIINIVFLGLGP